jgi:hypothetical protein
MMLKQILLLACGVFLVEGGWQAWRFRRWPSGFVAAILGTVLISLVMFGGK